MSMHEDKLIRQDVEGNEQKVEGERAKINANDSILFN